MKIEECPNPKKKKKIEELETLHNINNQDDHKDHFPVQIYMTIATSGSDTTNTFYLGTMDGTTPLTSSQLDTSNAT